MAQFQIRVDMTDAGAQASAVIHAIALPRLNMAVQAVVQATRIHWMEAVKHAKLRKDERDAYSQSIQAKMTGDFSGEVWSEYKYADEIDNGRPARDLKKMLDTSQKVRRTKDGRRFLVIPFQHNTPGNEAHSPAMPASVYAAASALKASSIIGKSQRASGEMNSLHPVWGMQKLKKQSPFLSNPATRSAAQVHKNIYQWGGKLDAKTVPELNASEQKRYQGMVRFDSSAGGKPHSTFLSFRVMAEGSQGWIVKAKPGMFIVKSVAEQMQPLAEKAFSDALKRGG